LIKTPVAGDIIICPGIQVKPVKCDALGTDGDFGERRADQAVKAVPVHAQVKWRIPKPYQPGQ